MLKKFASKLLLLSVSVVLTLVFAEIVLRIAHIGYPSLGGKLLFLQPDPYTGLLLKPGVSVKAYIENDVTVKTNSAGFHDREHSKQKPPNTFRIAVLGDSFTEALQVPIEKTFSSVLERELGGCSELKGKNVEVINFGISGYGTAQELQMLRHYAWDYSPDLVLLAFFTGNDAQNNSRPLQQDDYRPYFLLQNGKLVLDDSFLSAPDFRSRFSPFKVFVSWSVAHSHLLQVAAAAKNYISQRNVEGVKTTEMGLSDDIYHEPTDPVWKDAWNVTDALIAEMGDEVKARGAQFLVVTLSSSIQVDPDPAAREQLMKRLGVPNLFYPDEHVAQVSKRDDIPVLTLAPIFLQYAQEHHAHLHGFRGSNQGHWNESAHQLGGELMAQKICGMQTSSAASTPARAAAGISHGMSSPAVNESGANE
jgi:hypothetical protein